ncbi:MAG: enoyl-CoA hydratase-related protein, partial [Actinomycetota bacterium]
MSDEPAVLTEKRDRVLLITLNRPDAMNAINGALSAGLVAATEELDNDPGLTAGVLTGAGRGFCSGMDLKAFARGEDIGPMMTFVKDGAKKPLIGAIEGFALAGGLELALSCDLLVAAKGVKLGIPEAGVGLFAAGGVWTKADAEAVRSAGADVVVVGRAGIAHPDWPVRIQDPG